MAEFNQNIMKWVEYDVIKLNLKMEIKETSGNTLEGSIIEFIQNNNLEDNLFNISSMDTQLSMIKLL